MKNLVEQVLIYISSWCSASFKNINPAKTDFTIQTAPVLLVIPKCDEDDEQGVMRTLVEAIWLGQGLRYLRIQNRIRAGADFLKHIRFTGQCKTGGPFPRLLSAPRQKKRLFYVESNDDNKHDF